MKVATLTQMEELQESEGYAEYIMNNCGGERVICNGDTLLEAIEDGYLFDEYLETLGLIGA